MGFVKCSFEAGLKTSVDIFRHAITGESHGWSLADLPGCFDEVNTRPIRQTNVAENDIKLPLSELLTGCRDRRACFNFVSHLLQNSSKTRAVSS